MDQNAKTVVVNLWGSHPDSDNDDCWTCVEFPTLQAAADAMRSPKTFPFPGHSAGRTVAYFESGTETAGEETFERCEVVCNPLFRPSHEDDAADRSEAQMQAAMGFGVQGWNDYEGGE